MQLGIRPYLQYEEVSELETLLVITVIIFSLGFLFEKVTNFFKEMKSGSAKLAKGFEARLSFVPIDSKKSEVSATNTNFTYDYKLHDFCNC